ncbi:serpin B12-like [Centruroides sculpturatus]|nr:serpin B12-like [Centruroides sculpturatus]
MKYFIVLLLFVFLFCTQSNEFDNLVKSNNKVASLFYKELRNNDGNIFFSPLSLTINIAMLYRGAGSAMEGNILHFDEEIHESFRNLMNGRFKNSSIEIANGILFDRKLWINQSYIKDIINYYNPMLASVNFNADPVKIQQYINDWVNKKTHHHIKTIELSTDDQTTLVFLNAVYFKGIWLTQFNKKNTHDDFFQNKNNVTSIKMMKTKGIFRYAFNNEFDLDVLELPYSNDDVSMFILMPRNINGMEKVENNLSSELFDQIFCHLTTKSMTIFMPKFSLETSYDMSRYLEDLNLEGFVYGISNICNCDKLMLDGMFQKTKLIVDEKGTEAIAVTYSKVSLSGFQSEIQLKIDRPFLFVIRDSVTGLILFLGKIENL